MVRIFYGLLTAYIIMLFIVAMLFNIAPITYIVFGVAIVLLLVLQYDWYKKHALSEKTHIKLICCVFIIFNLCLAGLVADWLILKRLLNKPMDLSLVLWTGNEVGQMMTDCRKV